MIDYYGIARVINAILRAEIRCFLGYRKYSREEKESINRRNGYSNRTIKIDGKHIQIEIPRDRLKQYNTRLIHKYQYNIDHLLTALNELATTPKNKERTPKIISTLYDETITTDLIQTIYNEL